jgi:hypothetical protein
VKTMNIQNTLLVMAIFITSSIGYSTGCPTTQQFGDKIFKDNFEKAIDAVATEKDRSGESLEPANKPQNVIKSITFADKQWDLRLSDWWLLFQGRHRKTGRMIFKYLDLLKTSTDANGTTKCVYELAQESMFQDIYKNKITMTSR